MERIFITDGNEVIIRIIIVLANVYCTLLMLGMILRS